MIAAALARWLEAVEYRHFRHQRGGAAYRHDVPADEVVNPSASFAAGSAKVHPNKDRVALGQTPELDLPPTLDRGGEAPRLF